MITLFNETKTTWEIAPMRTENMAKLKFTKKVNPKQIKSFELVTSTDIKYDEKFNTYKEMVLPVSVVTENTEVRFLKKTTAPMLIKNTNEKYKRDILLISVPMYGYVLKDIIGENSYVINYMIAKGELVLTASVSGGDDDTFGFVLHNVKDHTDLTYRFSKDPENNTFALVKSHSEPTDAIETPTYKIRKFRPNRATHLICADIKEKSKLEAMEKINPANHDIIYAKDSVEAIKHLEAKLEEGYKSVTVFGAKKSFFGTYDEIMNFVNEKYRIINLLRYDGGVVRK